MVQPPSFNVSTEVVVAKKILTVAEMLDAKDIEYAEVEAFGGLVRLGSLEAGQMIEFQEANEGPAKRTAGLRMIIQSLVDEDGNRIGDMKTLEQWKRRSQRTCNRIVEAVLKLNGIGETAKKAMTDAVKTLLADSLTSAVMQHVTAGTANEATVRAAVIKSIEDAVGKETEAPGNA